LFAVFVLVWSRGKGDTTGMVGSTVSHNRCGLDDIDVVGGGVGGVNEV